jgi:hypothetical protein
MPRVQRKPAIENPPESTGHSKVWTLASMLVVAVPIGFMCYNQGLTMHEWTVCKEHHDLCTPFQLCSMAQTNPRNPLLEDSCYTAGELDKFRPTSPRGQT